MDLEDNDSTVSDDEAEPLSFRAHTARVLALLAVLVIAGLWGWALFFPPSKTPPATLKDRNFPEAAEGICTNTAEQLSQFPKAFTTPNPIERADVVAKSDVILYSMLDQLDAVALPSDANEASNITEWLGDWRTYVGDREAYAAALRTDPDARFYVGQRATADHQAHRLLRHDEQDVQLRRPRRHRITVGLGIDVFEQKQTLTH
jgi:hypothetical protein